MSRLQPTERPGPTEKTRQLSGREPDSPLNQAPTVGNSRSLLAANARTRLVDARVDVADDARLPVLSLFFLARRWLRADWLAAAGCGQPLVTVTRLASQLPGPEWVRARNASREPAAVGCCHRSQRHARTSQPIERAANAKRAAVQHVGVHHLMWPTT